MHLRQSRTHSRTVRSGTPVSYTHLDVYKRQNKHISVQVIDDRAGHTLVAASTTEADLSGNGGNVDAATKVGELVAERAKAAGITTVVFDRGGNLYHGRIAALAEAARKGGLEF